MSQIKIYGNKKRKYLVVLPGCVFFIPGIILVVNFNALSFVNVCHCPENWNNVTVETTITIRENDITIRENDIENEELDLV